MLFTRWRRGGGYSSKGTNFDLSDKKVLETQGSPSNGDYSSYPCTVYVKCAKKVNLKYSQHTYKR